jgi:hypothetical protein
MECILYRVADVFLHLDNGERLQLLLVNQMVHLGGQH